MRVCFGDFELDAAARELRRGGEAVRVEPQVFDLIVYLIEKRARVVSRDDIIDAVWDGRIVSDAAISSRIKSARQALGDDGRAQAVIKTVHGKGFRFIADVAEPTDARAASRDARPSGAPRRVRPEETAARFGSRIGFKLAVPAAAVLSAAALAFLFFGRDDVAGPAGTRLAVLPIANATASEGYDWVELGLMSLVAHVLETEAGRAMVSPRSVVSAAATWSAPRAGGLAVDDVTLRRLRSAYGASHVVAARLGGEPGAFTIDFQIVSPRGTAPMRTIAGSEPTALATRLAREILATLPRSGETPTAGKTVSDDPFIAEAYARGRALQIKGAGAEARDLFKVASEQDPENFWLRYEFAVSTRMAGELDASETLLRELLDRVRATGEPRGEFAVLNALGRIAALRGDRAAAVELYERALEIAEREGGADDVGVVLTNLGIEERVRGNLDVAEAHLGRALTAFDDAGYDAPPGFLLNSLALLRIRRGDPTAGEDYLERAVASLELAGEDRAVAAALRNLAEMRERRGRWPEAADQLERSLTLRRAVDDRRGEMSTLALLARLRWRQGRFADAETHANALRQLAERMNDRSREAQACILLGDVAFSRDELSEAEAHYQLAYSYYQQTDKEASSRGVEMRLVAVAERRDPGVARRVKLRETAAWAAEEDNHALAMDANGLLADALIAAGAADAAAQALKDAAEASRRVPNPAETGRFTALLGHLELDRSDQAAAEGLFGLANELHADHYQTRLLAARLADRAGRRSEADRLRALAEQAAGDHWAGRLRAGRPRM